MAAFAISWLKFLAVLLNNKDIDIGQTLTEFKDFTKDLDSNMKGLALSNSD